MKQTIYTCDGRIPANEVKGVTCCQSKTNNIDGWIEIGSENHSLNIHNGIERERSIISASRYHDLHFCSKECMINYFFKTEYEIQHGG